MVFGRVAQKGDQLKVGIVGKDDQRIMGGPIGVRAARRNRETQRGVVGNCGVEVVHQNNDMVERADHSGVFPPHQQAESACQAGHGAGAWCLRGGWFGSCGHA